MKIIYVTASLPHGADEAFVIPEIGELMRLGHEVRVVPRSPRGRILHGHGLLKHARREALCSHRVLGAAAVTMLAAPRRTITATRPLVDTRSTMLSMKNLAVVPKALWLARMACAWQADHIHCHWAGTTASMAMLASRISGIPWSFTAHRWDIVEDNVLLKKARSASLARFISNDGLAMAQAMGVSDNARVLHMGVSIPRTVRRRHGARPVVLCPARLVEVKGHRFLLEAWRMVRRNGVDGELWVAGQGELRVRLECLCAALGLADSVRFLGGVPHQELLKIYEEGRVSAVVLSSVDLGDGFHEGIPVALIEAMSYGIPVVATATGGIAELVAPGAGLLVPPADPVALASAIRSLLRDHQLNEQLGESGRQRVTDHYDIVRIVAELVNEFKAATPATAPGSLQYA
ncbi:MAG TPA: glycosyltransferase [Bryobacteraceae bacterium]|nr:glycosyltransferase [Bryobacteraceae bacterium]